MGRDVLVRARGRRIASVLILATAVAGCGPVASPSPSATPAGPSSPAVTAPPAPTASPSASASPSVTAIRWVPAGDGAIELLDGRTVAMPDGGALRIGMVYHEDETVNPMIAQRWDPGTGTWRSTTPLERMRTDFAAIALRDGRVLVAGGYNGQDASYSSAYLFDPATEMWTKTGLMDQARTAPAIALLPDGRVLVAGGYFYDPDPEQGAVDSDLVLAAARIPPPGGVPGGPFDDVDIPPRGRALATAEIYDPATDRWSSTGPMRYARAGAAAVTLADGRVLVAGATDHNVHLDDRAYDTAELYDPASGRFAPAGTLPSIDRDALLALGVRLPEFDGLPGPVGTAVALPDGDAVLIGHGTWWKHQAEVGRSFRFHAGDGSWTEIGDTFASSWDDLHTTEARTPAPSRLGAVTGSLLDGSVVVAGGSIGGETGWGEGGRPPIDALRYDPAAGTWSSLPDLPATLYGPQGIGLSDGSVLLIGGALLVGSGEDAQLQWTPISYRLVQGKMSRGRGGRAQPEWPVPNWRSPASPRPGRM